MRPVARMERSVIRELSPGFASLHPGYGAQTPCDFVAANWRQTEGKPPMRWRETCALPKPLIYAAIRQSAAALHQQDRHFPHIADFDDLVGPRATQTIASGMELSASRRR